MEPETMTKFVKLNQFIAKGEYRPVVLNVERIETITPREGRLCIWTSSGDNIEIDEDHYPALGIDVVQELHSGWEEPKRRPGYVEIDLTDDSLNEIGGIEYVKWAGEPSGYTWTMNDGVIETHQFGTQQYVKDES